MLPKVLVIPLARETLDVSKRTVLTGRVRLEKHVRTERVEGNVPAVRQEARIVRVAKDEVLGEPPTTRLEGDTFIIPVVEEVLVVEKRYRVREEIHVERTSIEELVPYGELLRAEDLQIERIDAPKDEHVEEDTMAIGRDENQNQSLVVGFFDDAQDAREAKVALEASGIPKEDLQIIDRAEHAAGTTGEKHSFWDDVKHFFGFGVPDEERDAYGKGLASGGTLLSVRCDADDVGPIRDIMQAHHAVDIDQRMAEWTGNKPMGEWTGSSTPNVQPPISATGIQSNMGNYQASGTAHPNLTERTGNLASKGAEVVVPVVEEDLRVGKREVEKGGVRVYQRVSERPVEEQVRLREEQVHVERVPVDRPIASADPAFQERTYEVTETAEEVVVSKQARVVEEVVVSRDIGERTETIRDTLRRTDVDVEPIQAGGARTQGSAGLGAADIEDAEFREHYDRSYASRGLGYETFAPAYRFGSQLGTSGGLRDASWDEIEPEARPRWEESHPGTWTEVKDAIRHAFDRARQRMYEAGSGTHAH